LYERWCLCAEDWE